MPKKINKLTKLKTLEVSLVARGANNKLFALTKSGDIEMKDVILEVLKAEAEGEKELVETLKSQGKDEDFISVATANYRLQTGFKDIVDAEGLANVAKAAGLEGDEEKPCDLPPTPPENEDKTVDETRGEEMKEVEKAFNAKLEALQKAAEAKDERIAKLENEARHVSLVAKCEAEFSHVPGLNSDEQAVMLAKAYDVSEEFGASLEKQWSATSELVAANVATVHKTREVSNGKLSAVVKNLRKENPALSEDLAIAKALENNPELYEG